MLQGLFTTFEGECKRSLEAGYVLPAYDYVLKCSHAFNLLDARGAISVTSRQGYILRVRALSKACCTAYLELVTPADEPDGVLDVTSAGPATLKEGGAR